MEVEALEVAIPAMGVCWVVTAAGLPGWAVRVVMLAGGEETGLGMG